MLTDHFPYLPGRTIHRFVIRLADNLLLDFGDGTFKATPAQQFDPMAEGEVKAQGSPLAGFYSAVLQATPAEQFKDGEYLSVYVENLGKAGPLGQTYHQFKDGSESPAFPMAVPFSMSGTLTPGLPGTSTNKS